MLGDANFDIEWRFPRPYAQQLTASRPAETINVGLAEHSGYRPLPNVIVDLESKSLSERFALIKSPRRNRPRYPEGCVTLVTDEAGARSGANPDKNLHPAIVYGPSHSSEGVRVFYLVRWLD